MTTTYPIGYGTQRVTLTELIAFIDAHICHPGYRNDFVAWIVSEKGLIGVGSGWRTTPHPVSEASRNGMSFHQYQTFASGITAYSAHDLVVGVPNARHRAPTWDEVESAKKFNIHAFITGEPWHTQDMSMRGYATWLNAGRPDPQIDTPTSPPTHHIGESTMTTLPTPVRKYDSRYYDDRLKAGLGSTTIVNLRLQDHVPDVGKVTGVTVNITAVLPDAPGFITVWGDGPRPQASNVNYQPGDVIANLCQVPVTAHGSIKIYTLARTHFIVDLQAVEITP